MKYLLLFLFMLPGVSWSAPFVVSDWTLQDVTHCGQLFDTTPSIDVPVEVDLTLGKRCKLDLAGLPAGTHTIKATFVRANDPVWGRLESVPSVPFTLVKPGTPTLPGGLHLIP